MKEDIIVALATPQGSAGISVVRISGAGSLDVARKFCALPEKIEPRYMYLCKVDLGSIQDNALVVYFKSPQSYTGEDTVEIQCHGGSYVSSRVIQQAISYGARLAERGEYSKRAFVNGKMSLEQAEGIVDLINAECEAEAKASNTLIKGELYKSIEQMRSTLTDLLAKIEVSFDYPEHDIEYETVGEVKEQLTHIQSQLSVMLNTQSSGRLIKNGIRVVIVGSPNVGKSSILNRLLSYDRAIVTDIAGTTRDVIEDVYVHNGIKFVVTDTAGIHDSDNMVERIGIDLAKNKINEADIVLLVLDGSRDLSDEDLYNLNLTKSKNRIIVSNKSDLGDKISHNLNVFKVSAKKNIGIAELKEEIYNRTIDKGVLEQDIILTNSRHVEGVKEAKKHISNGLKNIDNVSLDCIAVDIKNAWIALGKITGNTCEEEIIDKIFSKFCLGK